ncbi:hypothetical protein L1987_89054 [Smallanthus sonchifolius]|nr:hypothetical protein L1987_89725 [Smallanthus sonchifolius]KAI3666435.1 hypothetical protein L1987_89054 [Smallanthus sonchifolius]
MKEPTSDTEGRYGDGAARTKVRSPKPKALFYHVCSNRIELLFQNGEHKVALVRSAIKQVAKSMDNLANYLILIYSLLEVAIPSPSADPGGLEVVEFPPRSTGSHLRPFQLSSGRKKRSPYCWSARLSPFPKEYFRMHNLSGNSRLSSLCSSVSRPSSPSIVSSLETSVTSLKSPVSFYPIEAVVPIATVLRPLVGVLSAALAVEFFLISSATSRGLLTRLCFLSGPLLNKNVGRKSVRRLSVGKAKASLLLLLELHKKDGSGEKSYPQAFAYRMVEGGRGQDHRKREEQGRRSFLKEDDSKINSKRRIGCLKAGQKSGNFLRDALLRYDAPFFEVDSPRSNDKEPKAKMAAEESDG